MARCFNAKKSKAGKEIKCGRCEAKIVPGELYFYFAVGFRGVKQIRCKLHHPKQSELCGNKMSGAYAANENIEATLNDPHVTISDIASTLEDAAGEIEQVRDEYQDSYDNLPENFQQADQGQEIESNIEGLTSYAETLQIAADEVTALESEVTEAKSADENTDDEDDPQTIEDLLDQAKELAQNALDEFSL